MSEKPVWIEQFERPAGTEIKHIGSHWYLYERLSVYDRERKKKRKKSGRCLGAITEEGLKPSKRTSPLAAPDLEMENREYGATVFLHSLAGSMRERLKRLFPDCWREAYVLALLKCKEQCPFKRMDFHYRASFLERICPGVSLSAGRITEILRHLGANREGIRMYMKGDLPSGGVVMFDGHRILSNSDTLEYARVGYDSKCRFLPQVNLVYMFNVLGSGKFPIFYKQFSGDVPDIAAFGDILADSGLRKREVTVIADKGFESDANEEALNDASLGYVMAVRRGSADIGEIPDRPEKYQMAFNFRGRAIYCNVYPGERENTFLYYDMNLANDEAVDFIARKEKANNAVRQKMLAEDKRRRRGKGRLTDEEYMRLKPVDVAAALQEHRANGTFILKTNRLELNCVQAYYLYKTRQDIEQAFKFYDNTLDASASYMRSHQSFEGWLFINHLALQMLYAVIGKVMDKEMSDKYSFDDVMAYLKHVRVNQMAGTWRITKITKNTAKAAKELGIELDAPESLQATLK